MLSRLYSWRQSTRHSSPMRGTKDSSCVLFSSGVRPEGVISLAMVPPVPVSYTHLDVYKRQATYTTNQYILPPVYKRFLALRLPVSLWIHTLRDVDITQALLSHELDFAFIDSNTVFDDRLTVRPAFREPFLLLSPPDSHYPEEVDPASLDIAEELLVTWDPEFIRWHDRWFGTGARPLLYADTLQAADFLPPTEGRWVAAPAIAAASRIGKSARVCRFTSPPPDRVNYLVTRAGEPLTPPALRFLQELKGHLLAQDNVQVYL